MTLPSRRLRWTTFVRLLFSGWYPGRNAWCRLKLPPSFEVFPEAQRVLTSYGNLKFGNTNEHARLDPSSGEEVVELIRQCEAKSGRRLYPVGYSEHQDRVYYLVDERGIVYLFDGETLHAMATSFERALDHIARQVIRRRDVEKDLATLGMAGQRWLIDDPG